MTHEAPCSLTTLATSMSLAMLVMLGLVGIESGMK
jgi:hypothetical protein